MTLVMNGIRLQFGGLFYARHLIEECQLVDIQFQLDRILIVKLAIIAILFQNPSVRRRNVAVDVDGQGAVFGHAVTNVFVRHNPNVFQPPLFGCIFVCIGKLGNDQQIPILDASKSIRNIHPLFAFRNNCDFLFHFYPPNIILDVLFSRNVDLHHITLPVPVYLGRIIRPNVDY